MSEWSGEIYGGSTGFVSGQADKPNRVVFITLLDCSIGTTELKASSYFTSNYIYMPLDQFNGAIPNKRKCGTTSFTFAQLKKLFPYHTVWFPQIINSFFFILIGFSFLTHVNLICKMSISGSGQDIGGLNAHKQKSRLK